MTSSYQEELMKVSKHHGSLFTSSREEKKTKHQVAFSHLLKLQRSGKRVKKTESNALRFAIYNALDEIGEADAMNSILNSPQGKEALDGFKAVLNGRQFDNPNHDPNGLYGNVHLCFSGHENGPKSPIIPFFIAFQQGAQTISYDKDGSDDNNTTMYIVADCLDDRRKFSSGWSRGSESAHEADLLINTTLTECMRVVLNSPNENEAELESLKRNR